MANFTPNFPQQHESPKRNSSVKNKRPLINVNLINDEQNSDSNDKFKSEF